MSRRRVRQGARGRIPTVSDGGNASPGVVITEGSPTIPVLGTMTFHAIGGTGTGYTWAMVNNGSGGAIVAGTGAYTAGSTGGGPAVTPVVDRISVTDSGGNIGFTNITVAAAFPSDWSVELKLDTKTLNLADGAGVASFPNAGTAGGTFTPPFDTPIYHANAIGSEPIWRSGAGATPPLLTSTLTLSQVATATDYYAAWVGIHNHLQAFSSGFGTPGALEDSRGFASIAVMSGTAGKIFTAYNWDGNEDDVQRDGTTGSPVLIMQKHTGGQLSLRVGSADTFHSVASGNTSDLTGLLQLGSSQIRAGLNADHAFLVVAKTQPTAAQEARLINYLQSRYGASL